MTGKPASKGPNILGALMDLIVLVLIVGAAGFGGYWYGTNQKMAPIQMVPPGTPGAQTINTSVPSTESKNPTVANNPPKETTPPKESQSTTSTSTAAETGTNTAVSETKSPAETAPKKLKYWICSSGTEYIGSSITVEVNNTPIDSFYGPGKTVDITQRVKKGENTIAFEPKLLGPKYNKHKDDSKAQLILKVVSGPFVSENYSDSDVLATYERSATDEDENKSVQHVVKN